MAEPIGGKEHKWGAPDLLKVGFFLNVCASVLGWLLLVLLPLYVTVELFGDLNRAANKLTYAGLSSFAKADLFWVPLGRYLLVALLIVLCAFWFIAAAGACILYIRHKVNKKSNGGSPEDASKAESSVPPETKSEAPAAEVAKVVSPELERKQAEIERKQAETERRKSEQERRERVDKARKEFKAKYVALRDSLQPRYEIKDTGGSIDFSEKLKSSALGVTMREGSLRSYLKWDYEAMVLKVDDAYAFNNDKQASFVLEVSDPIVAADPELRDEIKPEALTVILLARFPSVAQKFFDWKSKIASAVRLENAKQGQDVDYDIKAALGYDDEWAVWLEADGIGSLKADFEKHRLTGVPTVGSDTRIRVVFACKGSEAVRHELDLLLTCNMDPELRWKEIESTDSDKEPVVSEEDRVKLAKMAEAICSAANDSGARKPDATFSKPHRVSRRQKSGEFDVAYASIRGRSHIRSGSFREDDVEARFFLDGKALAIVVSDGAGSAPLSRRGSSIVSKVGMKCLVELGQALAADPDALAGRTQPAIDGFSKVVKAIQEQIGFEAECIKEQRPDFLAKEMYATFLAALVLPTPTGQVLLTYSAGDGAIGLALAGEASGLKCAPDHGQSAGQTLFVLNKGADDAEKRLMFTPLPESYALLLMSDGVSDPRFQDGSETKAEAWELIARDIQPLVKAEPLNLEAERVETYKERGALCEWLDSYEKGHHDDRTIAVLFHKIS